MSAVINYADTILQAASPRIVTVNLGAGVNVNGTVNGVSASTVVNNAQTGASHASSIGNVHNVSFSQIAGDLDSISDGVTYFRTTQNQKTGAGRAFSALDSSNDYIRSLVSTKMTVVGANPATGIAIDANGIRMYQSSALKVNIPVSGAPSFSGDITGGSNLNITGQATFGGNVTSDSTTWSAVCNPSGASTGGIIGWAGSAGAGVRGNCVSSISSSRGVEGIAGSGTGVYGVASTGIGVKAQVTGSGTALQVIGPMTISSTTLVSNLNADMVDGLHASSLAKISGGNSFSGNQYVTGGNLDVSGWVQCDNFRIDQTPSTGSATATFTAGSKPGSSTAVKWIAVNANGSNGYMPWWPA